MSLSPIDKIDIVLGIFKPFDGKLENGENKETIQRALKNDLIVNIDDRLLNEILFKLEKDSYLRGVESGHIIRDGSNIYAVPGNPIYTLTFEGELFILSGMYKQQTINFLQNEKRIKRNDRMLAYGTVFAAIGTIGLLLWEIDKAYFHLFEKLYHYLFCFCG